jgi:Fur family ferric uptake transcriptional regulator
MRRTEPRIAILSALIGRHGPYTVDEIADLKEAKGIDRVTIYRCLAAFEEIGIVQRCEFGDGVSRYEYARGHHHHHVVCRQCGQLEAIEQCIPGALTQAVQNLGYSNVTHSLEFFGVCHQCDAD